MGDFNAIRSHQEKLGGNTRKDSYSDNLNLCCREAKLDDLQFIGNYMTWNNCSEGDNLIACKLDRVLVNDGWKSFFPDLRVNFLNSSFSYHSSCLVKIGLN